MKLQYKDEKKSAWSRKLYSGTLDQEIPSKHCRLGIQDWRRKRTSVPKAAPIYSAETKDCDFFRRKIDHSENTDNSEKTRPTKKSEKRQNHDHYIMIHATVE